MEQYFLNQEKIVDGVPQLLFYILTEVKNGTEFNTLKSLKQEELPVFSTNHVYVNQASEITPVFKIKE